MLSISSAPWSLHEPQHSGCLCPTSLLRGLGLTSQPHPVGILPLEPTIFRLKPCWSDSEAKPSTWGGPAFSASPFLSCKGKLRQEPAWEGPPTQVLAVGLGHCIYCVLYKGTQPTAGWGDLPPLFCLTYCLPGTKGGLLRLVLPEAPPSAIGSSRADTFFLLALPEGRPISVGCHREGTFYYWSSQRWWLLFYTKLPCVLAGGPGCRIPRMLGPCGALASARAGVERSGPAVCRVQGRALAVQSR